MVVVVNLFKFLFEIEKKPKKGLLAVEWVVMGYLVLTLLLILFAQTKMQNPEPMLWGRFRIVMMTIALWAVYRMIPCRFTHFCRIGAQLLLLPWWYPDTYLLNRIFPNLDHIFAGYEQQLLGCQPALFFAQSWSHPVFSELMHLSYASYYPMIALVTLFYFFCRYKEFDRTEFIILNIANGTFPDVGNYFATHNEALPSPGYAKGFFYQCVASAHETGEQPTAAFPSSHVGVTTILMILAWRSQNRKLFYGMLPLFILMCFATVYIQAHYVIDVLGGWVSGIIIFAVLHFLYGKIWPIRK